MLEEQLILRAIVGRVKASRQFRVWNFAHKLWGVNKTLKLKSEAQTVKILCLRTLLVFEFTQENRENKSIFVTC